MNPAPLRAFASALRRGDYGLIDRLLIIRHGRIVMDEKFHRDYANIVSELGPGDYIGINHGDPVYDYDNLEYHPFYKGSELHSLQSVTKSVTSAVIGIAIDEGLIEDVDIRVMPFFKDYRTQSDDPRAAAITLEDLLTMRSGIDWELDNGYGDATNSTAALEASDNWVQFVLDRPMYAEPGTVFEYNDGVSVLLGKILREATGQRIDRYAVDKLFIPIGIDQYYWKITPDGEADTEGGLYLSAEDLARIGYLFLREGMWKGKRIVSADWVRESTRPRVFEARGDLAYGYQWWISQHEKGETRVFEGSGFGGQRPFVIPEHDLVVVINGWDIRGDHAIRAKADLLNDVLPAAFAAP